MTQNCGNKRKPQRRLLNLALVGRALSTSASAHRGAVTPQGEYATDRTPLFSDTVEEPQTSTILSLPSHQKHIRHEVRPHDLASQVPVARASAAEDRQVDT